jgi:hypothetical protein
MHLETTYDESETQPYEGVPLSDSRGGASGCPDNSGSAELLIPQARLWFAKTQNARKMNELG